MSTSMLSACEPSRPWASPPTVSVVTLTVMIGGSSGSAGYGNYVGPTSQKRSVARTWGTFHCSNACMRCMFASACIFMEFVSKISRPRVASRFLEFSLQFEGTRAFR